MNVAAIKQVVPYARFLVRASMEKRRAAHRQRRAGRHPAPGHATMRPKAVPRSALLLVAAAYLSLAFRRGRRSGLALAFGLLSQALFSFPAC